MRIHANQHNLEDFHIIFRNLMDSKSPYTLDQQICEELSHFLMLFNR